MAGHTKQPTRNRKIEPLNWAETANSPALKGMMSFLDIMPEEVRSGHFKDVPLAPDLHLKPVGESLIGTDDALKGNGGTKMLPLPAVVEIWPKRLQTMPSLQPSQQANLGATQSPVNISSPNNKMPPASDSYPGSVSSPISEPLPVNESIPTGESLPAITSLYMSRIVLGSVPSQNRKIRKCRLSQDAHSAGEETLYRILWEEGSPATVNPLGSRIVRIGYAELANKARMHKANVRLNLANLTAKLAIEQSGDFNSRDMIAKTYRVLSYKEILERRRVAGLEYVIRQKNVVFVTPNGEAIVLPGLGQKGKTKGQGSPVGSKAYQHICESLPTSETLPISEPYAGEKLSFHLEDDLACVSRALNTYWSVDDAAADQLIRACRTVRSDAQAEEIAFFVREKLELTRSNRAINNPVGLILATVPQSFSGYSFDTFRKRRQESKRLAEEEKNRKTEEDRMLKEWMVKDAQKTLASPNSTEKQRLDAEDVIDRYSETEV